MTGVWKAVEVKRLNGGKLDKVLNGEQFEATYSIELSNAKKEDVTVKVVEPLPGDWNITAETFKHEKVGADLAQWQVPVPADGKVELKYTVRIKF